MRGARRQVPGEKAVDRAEGEFASLRTGRVIEQPLELGRGEVGIETQTGFLGNRILVTRLAKLAAQIRGAPVLPDNGIAERLRVCEEQLAEQNSYHNLSSLFPFEVGRNYSDIEYLRPIS